MNSSKLTSLLTSNIDVDPKAIADLVSNCQSMAFKKGTALLQAGEICMHSFFVEAGLLRMFGIDEKGKEHILQFAPEGWFVSDRESVYFNQPTSFYIEALEDSTVLLFDEQFISELAKINPNFIEFNNRLLHNHIRQQTNRIYQLLSYTAEERYLKFIKLYPDILLRVPQTMVASYLGITPESLSRVRKELATKHQR